MVIFLLSHTENVLNDEAMDELGDEVLHLQLEETSIYQPDLQYSDSSSSTDSSNGTQVSSDSIQCSL